jgi:shikimate kinase
MMGTESKGEDARDAAALRERLGGRSVVLVGMPGSGKSSVGRRLAARLGLEFVDADAKIEEAAGGMSIADIFAIHGEPYFRTGEAKVIARILESGPVVLATGGGAFMSAQTRERIRRHAVSVWLKADFAVLLRRIKRKNDRPLFHNGDHEGTLRRLLSEREPLFAEADIVALSQDGPHEVTVDIIIAELQRWLGAQPAQPAAKEAWP